MATASRPRSALALGAARAGGERAKRRSTPLLSGQLDAETAAPLECQTLPLICSPAETAEFPALPSPARSDWPKLAFSAKEAFYKCVDPILGEFLDFLDARVRFRLAPARNHGTFEVELLRPDLSAPVTGHWAVDAERVYAGACWPRG